MATTLQTQVANDIDATRENISLDRQIKVVLANKSILARILAHTMREFKGMDYDSIINCIEGNPEIGSVEVVPGKTNLVSEKITGTVTEDTVPNEGTIYFDIRLYVRIPGSSEKEPIKILVNIEAQKSFYPGYDIVTRAIFYGARMLSAQLSTEFTLSGEDKVKYDNMKKVYSIWICMDASQNAENTIDEYYIERKNIVGCNTKATRYDLMSIVMICLSRKKDVTATDNELLKMLTTLLDEELDAKEKKQRLEREHGIPMTLELEQEVNDMCNLSEYYEERATERGLKKGIEQERVTCIERMLKNGKTPEQIADFCGYTLEEVLAVQKAMLESA